MSMSAASKYTRYQYPWEPDEPRDAFALMGKLKPDWHADALCRTAGSEPFFPERGEEVSTARSICRDCPVRADCLEHALRHEKHGIWAGTSEKQRRRMRRDMGIRLVSLWADEADDDESDEQEESEW